MAQGSGPPGNGNPVTQEALDRVEGNLRESARRDVLAMEKLLDAKMEAVALATQLRSEVVDRRLNELNNSHDRAIAEKARTDAAAVAEKADTISRDVFQQDREARAAAATALKDEMRERFETIALAMATQSATAAQAGRSAAKVWSLVTLVVGIVLSGLVSYFTRR